MSIKDSLSLFLLATFVVLFSSCSSISNNYKATIKKEDYAKFNIQQRTGEKSVPKVIQLNSNADIFSSEELIKLQNNSNLMIGYGNFSSTSKLNDGDFEFYGQYDNKEVDYILYQRSYLGSSTSTLQYDTPTQSTTYHSGNAYSSYGSASYSGTSTTYGTKTNYVPITSHHYGYLAVFLSKSNICESLKFGLGYQEAPTEIQKKVGRRDLYKVNRVCTGSEGYNKGLFVGDYFTLDKELQERVPAAKQEQEVNIVVFREDKVLRIKLID